MDWPRRSSAGGGDPLVGGLALDALAGRVARYLMPADTVGRLRTPGGFDGDVSVADVSSRDATLVCRGIGRGDIDGEVTLHLRDRDGALRAIDGTARVVDSPVGGTVIATVRFDHAIDPARFSGEAWLTERLARGEVSSQAVVRLAASVGELMLAADRESGGAMGSLDAVWRRVRLDWALLSGNAVISD